MSEPDYTVTWIIEDTKITQYLLNLSHKQGASKARYLLNFGFSVERPEQLASTLVRHAAEHLPGRTMQPAIGMKRFIFEGPVDAPDGRTMSLRTVWEVCGNRELRLLTAVPLTK